MHDRPKRRKLTKAERSQIYDKCGGHCAYCGIEITPRQMQADHVMPFEFVEVYEIRNINLEDIANMLPACRSCNYYKSSLTLEEFRGAIERWPEVLERDSVTYRNARRFGMVEAKPHKVVFYFEQSGLDITVINDHL